MLREIRPAILVLVLLTLITGLAYPLAMTGIAGGIFPKQAQGSLIERDGKVIGSALIGQEFKDDKYFHGRPSATTAPDPADSTKTVPAPYNAANSGASNLGPTSKALDDRIKEDVDKLKAENASRQRPDRSRHDVGKRARPGHLAGRRAVPGAACREGAEHAGRSCAPAGGGEHLRPSDAGLFGEPRVNVSGAQSGAGRGRQTIADATPSGEALGPARREDYIVLMVQQQRRDPEQRPSPEALLEAARRETSEAGRLKIFVGAAPGVGKTYEMLQSAHARRKAGVDVVVGVVETHGRAETEALLHGLEVIPRKRIAYGIRPSRRWTSMR